MANQAIWAIDYYGIWKLDLNGNPVARAELPEFGSYPLADASAIVPLDASTVMLVKFGSGQMVRYFLDVSHF